MSDYRKELYDFVERSHADSPRSIGMADATIIIAAADEIASLRAQLASARKALEHAQVRFRCVADDAEERGDTAAWAMASVDADRMATALMTRKGKS